MDEPPNLARAREILQQFEEEIDRMRKLDPRDPGVSRLEHYVSEMSLTLADGSPARASPEVWRKHLDIAVRLMTEVAVQVAVRLMRGD
jgi:hypothetical protein